MLYPSYYVKGAEYDECVDQEKYQATLGSLLFISRITRPDIAIHVNLLGRRVSKPTRKNYQAALRVLSYLKATSTEGIILRKPDTLEVKVLADAAYGWEQARSQSGAMLTLGGQLVGWTSRRQDVVALSSTESEYISDCEGAKDAAWIRQLLQELQVKGTATPVLVTDSEGAAHLAKTNAFLRRTRHINHRYHYLRQEVKAGNLKIQWVKGSENQADPLTKLLPMTVVQEWKKRWISRT